MFCQEKAQGEGTSLSLPLILPSLCPSSSSSLFCYNYFSFNLWEGCWTGFQEGLGDWVTVRVTPTRPPLLRPSIASKLKAEELRQQAKRKKISGTFQYFVLRPVVSLKYSHTQRPPSWWSDQPVEMRSLGSSERNWAANFPPRHLPPSRYVKGS